MLMATLYSILQWTPFLLIGLLILLALGFLPVFILNKIRKRPQWKTLIVWASLSGILIVVGIAGLVALNQWERLDRLACEKEGGEWSYLFLQGPIWYEYPFSCDFPTTDGGRECTDSSQCTSFCAPPQEESARSAEVIVGTCYGRTDFPNAGCFQFVENGKIRLSGGCAF